MGINWRPIQDRHQEGQTKWGPVWIRLGRDGEVASWYTCFEGVTEKGCASHGDTIELVRLLLQEELDRYTFSRELSIKNT